MELHERIIFLWNVTLAVVPQFQTYLKNDTFDYNIYKWL